MLDEDQIREAESNGHSLFGASSWHRKLTCPGSVMAEFGLPDTAGIEAAEGTIAHEIAAFWLEYGLERQDFDHEIGKVHKVKHFEITVTGEMLDAIREYVDWCRAVPCDHYYVETRVDFSRLTPIPNQGGTADYIAVTIDEDGRGHVIVSDLKYGEGVMVYAEKNPQLSAYALGVIFLLDWLYDFDKVTLRIGQPRRGHWDTWETTRDELLEWGEEAKARLALTWQPDAPRVPSEDGCKFCRARATCPAPAVLAEALADGWFEDETEGNHFDHPRQGSTELTVTPKSAAFAVSHIMTDGYEPPKPNIKALSTAEIARILKYRKFFEHSFDAMAKELDRRVVEGNEPVPDGWMLAEGKSSRAVLRSKAVKLLRGLGFEPDDLYEKVERSASKLEKYLIDEGVRRRDALALVGRVVVKNPGKPTLTLKGKGKKAVVDLADDTFTDETASQSENS